MSDMFDRSINRPTGLLPPGWLVACPLARLVVGRTASAAAPVVPLFLFESTAVGCWEGGKSVRGESIHRWRRQGGIQPIEIED